MISKRDSSVNCYYYLFDGAKLIIFLYTLLNMQTLQANKSKKPNKQVATLQG